MTSQRKSFVLHKDSLDILADLTDEQAGKLFKAIHAYQINGESKLDQITKMVFLPFKNQFVRDDEKYLETCEKRAAAGSKGGKQKVANASKCKQDQANLADSVSKSKKDSDSESDLKDIVEQSSTEVKQVIELLNKLTDSKFKDTAKSHSENINARLKEGHSLQDLLSVVTHKTQEWLQDPKMCQYLRPSTLFSVGKFQGYLTSAKQSANQINYKSGFQNQDYGKTGEIL